MLLSLLLGTICWGTHYAIWASANQKGGVGKTTTVVSLAGLLAEKGHRVLMVDLDPHGSLSAYFGLDPDFTPASVTDLFELGGNIPPHPRLLSRTEFDNYLCSQQQRNKQAWTAA